MFFNMHLLALLLAPVMAYLAAALIFSLIESKKYRYSVTASQPSIRYRDGQHS